MVMRADIAAAAIDAARADAKPGTPTLYLSPRGKTLTQQRVRDLAQGPGAILLCGRFEGIDQRVLEARDIEEISIGDYVLSGGELAAQVLIDACVRLIPGVAGNESSLAEESFAAGLLEYPHYTRPRDFEGRAIPDVLLSGDHKKIAEWRRAKAEKLTESAAPICGSFLSENLDQVRHPAAAARAGPARVEIRRGIVEGPNLLCISALQSRSL